VILIVLGLLAVAAFVGWVAGHHSRKTHTVTVTVGSTATTTTSGTTTAGTSTAIGGNVGNPTAGKQVFGSAGCGGCHTLSDAGTSGNVGPNLDDAKPDLDLVVDRVTNGKGEMPSFKGQLTPFQIKSVAAYVYTATHR
jgi:mono/diheme cytochrome c family protein